MKSYHFTIRGPTKNSRVKFLRLSAVNYKMAVEKMIMKNPNKFIRIKKTNMDLHSVMAELHKKMKTAKKKIFYVDINKEGEVSYSEKPSKLSVSAWRNGSEIALPSEITKPAKTKIVGPAPIILKKDEEKVLRFLQLQKETQELMDVSVETGLIAPKIQKASEGLEKHGLVSMKLENNVTRITITDAGTEFKLSSIKTKKEKVMKTKSKKTAAKKAAKKTIKEAVSTEQKVPRGNNMFLTPTQWKKVDAILKKEEISFSAWSRNLVLSKI